MNERSLDPAIAARLKHNADGLFTAVVRERGSGDVLMVAWMDEDALAGTLETREATYFRAPATNSGSGPDVGAHPARAFGPAGL